MRFPLLPSLSLSSILVTLPAWLPLLLDAGLVSTRAGGDSPFLVQRVHQMVVALSAGHFPARWMPDAAFGFGYPFWNYYAPLAYYAAAAFDLAGLSIVNAIKLTQILGFLGAAAGMYALAGDMFRSRPAAVLAAAAYTYAPFHLVNIYVRGDSLGEFVAFAFYPLVFLGLRRLRARPGPGPAAATALSFAGLILSHNISALIFTPFAIAYALWLHIPHPGLHRARALVWTALALGLGLALSAWYWAPALLEQPAVQLEENLTGYFHYAGHFRSTNLVQPTLLVNFDVDAAGTPFAMGLTQSLLGLAALAAIVIASTRHNSQLTIDNSQFTIHNSQFTIRDPLFLVGTALLATFLITPWSRPLWDHVPLLPFVQFPWRWLSVQAFALSLLIGGLAMLGTARREEASRNTQHALRRATAIGLGILIIATSMPALRLEYLPLGAADVTRERLMLYEMFSGNIGSTVRAEYLPAAVVPRPWTSDELIREAEMQPLGVASAALLSSGPAWQQWQVTVDQPGEVVFPTYWFPGWRAVIDGQPAETSAQPGGGGIRLAMPAGPHRVTLTLGRTPTRRLAELASVVGGLVLAILLAKRGVVQRDLRRAAWLAGTVTVVTALLVATSAMSGPAAGPLAMDFSRMPYLHPSPGGIRFAGGLSLQAYHLSASEAAAGESISVDVAWNNPPPRSELHLALVSPAAVLFGVPATIAEAGASIEDRTTLVLAIPDDVAAGIYLPRLRVVRDSQPVAARTPAGTDTGDIYLQPVRIRPGIGSAEEVLGRFGDVAGLGPVQVARLSPEQLEVRLTWWAGHPILENYATSVRLKDATGETLAQADTQPCYGFCPTTSWQVGVPVHDRRWLELPAGIAPGSDYRLEVVLYHAANLEAVGILQLDDVVPIPKP